MSHDAGPGPAKPSVILEASDLLRAVHKDCERALAQLHVLQEGFGRSQDDLERVRTLIDEYSRTGGNAVAPAATEAATPRHHLRGALLGPLRVTVDGNDLSSWSSSRARALFTYLVTYRRRRIPREQLMEALWPAGDLEAAGNSLRVAVHALRQALAAASGSGNPGRDDFLLFENGVYSFSPAVQFSIDVEDFVRHWEEGRRLEVAGDPIAAVREYELAESVYAGDFLQDDPYDEWSMLRREGLKDIYLAILGRLSETAFEAGDYEGCIFRCQKILEHDACREDTYQRLMRSHMKLGQFGRAHRWYEVCVRVLREELDLPPSPESEAILRATFERRAD